MTELFTDMHWASRDTFTCKCLLSYIPLSTVKEILSSGYFLPYCALISREKKKISVILCTGSNILDLKQVNGNGYEYEPFRFLSYPSARNQHKWGEMRINFKDEIFTKKKSGGWKNSGKTKNISVLQNR